MTTTLNQIALPAILFFLLILVAVLIARSRGSNSSPPAPAAQQTTTRPSGPRGSAKAHQPKPPASASRPAWSPFIRAGSSAGKPAVGDDLMAIVGCATTAYPILLPTAMSEPGVRARIDALTSPKYFRGGLTNLSASMEQGLTWLEKSRNRVRRLIIISDGEPNLGVDRLAGLAERARKSRVSVCCIYAGEGNSPILQSISDKTVGGWHTSVRKMTDLAAAIRRAGEGALGGGRSSRRGIVVIVVDMSGSMSLPLAGDPGVTRIEGCRQAMVALLDHHRATYGVRVAA